MIGKARNALQRLYKTGVFFTHVPKCGGMSVEHGLRRAYYFANERIEPVQTRKAVQLIKPALDARALESETYHYRKMIAAYALERGVKCITGHCPYDPAFQKQFQGTHIFTTLLRDPVARFESHYRFDYKSGLARSIDIEPDEFLETPEAQDFGHIYVTYFAGLDRGEDPRSQDAIDKAKRAVETLDVVGFLDRMDDYKHSLCNRLSRNIKISHHNKIEGRRNAFQGAFTDAQRAKIKELCAPDMEIYEHARDVCGR